MTTLKFSCTSIADFCISRHFFAIFFLLVSLNSLAEDWQSEVQAQICEQWHQLSQDYLECQVVYPNTQPSFQLSQCDSAWQLKLLRPLQPGRNGLEISCDSPWWKQNLSIQLVIQKDIVALKRPVSAGQLLSAQDLTLIRYDIGSLSKDYFVNVAALVGKQIRRSFKSGSILSSDMIDQPMLVNRNDIVVIRLQRGPVSIELKGIAQENGRLGETIKVRNMQSEKLLRAKVTDKNTVEVK